MNNVVHLADRRPSRFTSPHPTTPDCDCASCDVRRMGRIAEQLRDEARTALLVDGHMIADRVDQIVHRIEVLCGLDCQRLETPKAGQ